MALLIKMNFIYKTSINNPIDLFQLKQQHTKMSNSYVKLQFYVYFNLADSTEYLCSSETKKHYILSLHHNRKMECWAFPHGTLTMVQKPFFQFIK